MRWDKWWDKLTKLKEIPVTPKTKLTIKNQKKEELLQNTKKNSGSIEKKKKDMKKKNSEKKKKVDDMKQLTVKEMIQNI